MFFRLFKNLKRNAFQKVTRVFSYDGLKHTTVGFSLWDSKNLKLNKHIEWTEKFESLPHIDNDGKRTCKDWGYSPNLYHFDSAWHVSWIHCSEGDTLEDFSGETIEEAVDKAHDWFHSTFCNG